jgi:hypothetical protein
VAAQLHGNPNLDGDVTQPTAAIRRFLEILWIF